MATGGGAQGILLSKTRDSGPWQSLALGHCGGRCPEGQAKVGSLPKGKLRHQLDGLSPVTGGGGGGLGHL